MLTQHLCVSANSICVLDFPHCAVHEMPELTAESLVSEDCRRGDRPPAGDVGVGSHLCVFLQEAGDNNQFCWRNLFSCINLLRILNKLTKWKHSRTMVRQPGWRFCPKTRSDVLRFTLPFPDARGV